MRDVYVLGIGVDNPGARPVLLLQETFGAQRVLPIEIDPPEMDALASADRPLATPCPGTHQLMAQLIGRSEPSLTRVSITVLALGALHAELAFDDGTRVDARPSDAVILAMHLAAPIMVAETVLDQVGVDPTTVVDLATVVEAGEPTAPAVDVEAEVHRFRRFLDAVGPDEFDTP